MDFIVVMMIVLVYILVGISVWKSSGSGRLKRDGETLLTLFVCAFWIVTLPMFVIIMISDVVSTWFGDKISKFFSILSSWHAKNT